MIGMLVLGGRIFLLRFLGRVEFLGFEGRVILMILELF